MLRQQQLRQLRANALRAYPAQIPRQLFNCRQCLLFYRKIQLSRETNGPHNPKRVLRKTFHRIADRPNHTVCEILASPEQIHDSRAFAICHGIYRKIASA